MTYSRQPQIKKKEKKALNRATERVRKKKEQGIDSFRCTATKEHDTWGFSEASASPFRFPEAIEINVVF